MCDPSHGARQGHAVRRIMIKKLEPVWSRERTQSREKRTHSDFPKSSQSHVVSFCITISNHDSPPRLQSCHRAKAPPTTTTSSMTVSGTQHASHRRYSSASEGITWCSVALPMSTLAVQCGHASPYMASVMACFCPQWTRPGACHYRLGDQGQAREWIQVCGMAKATRGKPPMCGYFVHHCTGTTRLLQLE
ncbi:hypothetical protein CONLIGDRAFT_80106 [Coniochaeta ligniaria NRRL 30616]|uniref:Uncharacterized protein n=1 Tax=Coniochaeta ligniaria NRRL 30616 TaxID=1408157 RepID=A0A1J7IC89_9PEZI|nr:hypothetical protein CONLIGDRAFT_80106 [Coniochaeta ligniaria NRRL 30616]